MNITDIKFKFDPYEPDNNLNESEIEWMIHTIEKQEVIISMLRDFVEEWAGGCYNTERVPRNNIQSEAVEILANIFKKYNC